MALSGPPSPAAGIMDMNAMMQRTQEMQKFRPTMPKDRWWRHILELLCTGLDEEELTETLVSTKVISEDMAEKAKEKGLRWLSRNAECDYLREQLQRRWIWLGPRVRPLMEKRRSAEKKEHVIEIGSGYGMDVRPMACRCKWLRFHPTDDWGGAQGRNLTLQDFTDAWASEPDVQIPCLENPTQLDVTQSDWSLGVGAKYQKEVKGACRMVMCFDLIKEVYERLPHAWRDVLRGSAQVLEMGGNLVWGDCLVRPDGKTGITHKDVVAEAARFGLKLVRAEMETDVITQKPWPEAYPEDPEPTTFYHFQKVKDVSEEVDLLKSISATKCAICGKDATLTTSKLGNLTARFFSKKCFATYWKTQKKYCSVNKEKVKKKQQAIKEAAEKMQKTKEAAEKGTKEGAGSNGEGVAAAAAKEATKHEQENAKQDSAQPSPARLAEEETHDNDEEFHDCN